MAWAKVFHDAMQSEKHVIDLDAVWRRQAAPEPLMRALLIAAEASAKVVVSPPTGVRNMSEWAKKQACWAEVRGLKLDYDSDFESCLIDPDDARSEVRQARSARLMTSGVEAQIRGHHGRRRVLGAPSGVGSRKTEAVAQRG